MTFFIFKQQQKKNLYAKNKSLIKNKKNKYKEDRIN